LYFVFQAVNNDSKITEGKVIDAKLLTNSIDQSCDPQENECYEYYNLTFSNFRVVVYCLEDEIQKNKKTKTKDLKHNGKTSVYEW
jgi:hypothetical protein